MKTSIVTAFTLAVVLASSISLNSQKTYQSNGFAISLKGTSNLHDWEMKAVKGTSSAAFDVDAKGVVTSITHLSFTLPAKNLKSDHTAMDKNTYKALKTDKNPNISFEANTVTINKTSVNNYQLICTGILNIAGTAKRTELVATGKYNPSDKSFTVTGVEKMKMTDFNVAPPKALLGTIKTGNDISIAYTVKFSK